jgi:RNA polymerase sigma-70 factor (ECF subfamily)
LKINRIKPSLKEEDHHIINGIRAGRESTYAQLFDEYYRPLSIFACKYVGDIENSCEIVQDFFVSLYENRRSLVITTSFRSYLYQAVRNRCLNHLKHNKIREKYLDQAMQVNEATDDIEARIEETELENRIFLIISELPAKCQEIFKMSRVDGLKNAEIATKLSISVRTVETQISRALKVLRDRLGSRIIS